MLKCLFALVLILPTVGFSSEQNLSMEKTKSSLVVKKRATEALILLQVDPKTCQIPLEADEQKQVLSQNNNNYQKSGLLPSCKIEEIKSQGKEDIDSLKEEQKKLGDEISIMNNLLGDVQDQPETRKEIEPLKKCVLAASGDSSFNKKDDSGSIQTCQSFCEENIVRLEGVENYYATCSFEGKLIFDEVKGNAQKNSTHQTKLGTCEVTVEGSGYYRFVSPGHPAYAQSESEIEDKTSFPIFSVGECQKSCKDYQKNLLSKSGGRSEQDYKITCEEKVADTVVSSTELMVKASTLHRLSEYPTNTCTAYLMGVDRAGKPYGNVKTNSSVQGNDCANFCEDIFNENVDGAMKDMNLEMRCKELDKMILTCNDGYGCS